MIGWVVVRQTAGGRTFTMHRGRVYGTWADAAAVRARMSTLTDTDTLRVARLVDDDAPWLSEDDEPLIDPDCQAGKHGSCVGGPCTCDCHGRAA